jgi:hypothetical protein
MKDMKVTNNLHGWIKRETEQYHHPALQIQTTGSTNSYFFLHHRIYTTQKTHFVILSYLEVYVICVFPQQQLLYQQIFKKWNKC